jgi:hypothetical protein
MVLGGIQGRRTSMKFMQVIEYRTAQFDEVSKLMDAWLAQTEGKRAAGQGFTGRDRDEPGKYVDVIVFPSYEEAMRNSDLPETQTMAGKMASLCDGQVTFHNLDVVREDNP